MSIPQGNDINLQLGWPSPNLFPAQDLNNAANSILTDAKTTTSALIYGPSRGYIPLRQQVARWLSSIYYKNNAEVIDETRICIANGASATLGLALLRFTDPTYTRHIWMVEPTYFLACPVFDDCGFAGKLRGIPEDDEGIDLVFLRAALAAAEKKAAAADDPALASPTLKTSLNGYEKIYKHIIYAVPTFSNPSGKTMSLRRRYELVRLAIEYDALVITDDVYDFLYWPREKGTITDRSKLSVPPRLVDINREIDPQSRWGNTMSNGSFSKIVAPGVRVSWVEGTPDFVAFLAKTGSSISGGNPAHVSSTFIEHLLSSGKLEKHIAETLIPCYESRYHAMISAIEEHLVPLGVQIVWGKPYALSIMNGDAKAHDVPLAGGFFLSIALPPTGFPPVPTLAKMGLENHGLRFAYGKMFEVKGDEGSKERSQAGFGSLIRLCWAYHDEEGIVDGIKRMRDLLLQNRTRP